MAGTGGGRGHMETFRSWRGFVTRLETGNEASGLWKVES